MTVNKRGSQSVKKVITLKESEQIELNRKGEWKKLRWGYGRDDEEWERTGDNWVWNSKNKKYIKNNEKNKMNKK